jgi:hypothetical protein
VPGVESLDRERWTAGNYTGAALDVLALVQRLDELVHEAKAVPMTDDARVGREDLVELIDEMRATIPEEIKEARWIVKERAR